MRLTGLLLGLGWLCLAQATPAEAKAKPETATDFAEAAIVRLARGEFAEAAQQARNALKLAPDTPLLHTLAGAILLNTGDDRAAQNAFTRATACGPDESVAHYGLSLALLARGDRSGALKRLQRAEENGGDPSYILVARRYIQWLDGAQISVGGAGLPEAFTPALHALEGMAAMRQGDRKRAETELTAAQETLPTVAVLQPGGLLLTFEPAHPLNTAAPRLPAGNDLDTPPAKERAFSGDIQFTPENLSPGVAYVSYELDGQSLSLVNVRPFQYTWDTRQAPNGWHTVDIVLYDRDGSEISRTPRRLRIVNTGGKALAATERERLARLQSALWQALTLRPDRCACAYALGQTYLAESRSADARHWFLRAAATGPEFKETRRLLLASGGLGSAEEAVWGGLATEKVVALTFDDGPKPGLTEPLLDILTQNQVPATFFVIGRHVMAYPELTRKIAAAGMEIANHSYTHRNLTKLPDDDLAREILQTQAAVQMVTGKTPRFLRPPGGNWNDRVAKMTRWWGLTPCMWTVDVYGSEVVGAQQVANDVLAQVRPGSIILMHNGKMNTLQALPTILRELKKRGYAFATVETLVRRLNAARSAEREAARLNAAYAARRSE